MSFNDQDIKVNEVQLEVEGNLWTSRTLAASGEARKYMYTICMYLSLSPSLFFSLSPLFLFRWVYIVSGCVQ